jgi:hypothetical protein
MMLAEGKIALQISKTNPPRVTGIVVLVGNNRPLVRLELELVRTMLNQADRMNDAADNQIDRPRPPRDRD